MKTLAMFLVLALALLTIGCEESPMNHFSGNPVAVAAPEKAAAAKTVRLDERIQIQTPEGLEGFADIFGEITYSVTKSQPASLGKELPVDPVYTLNITGKGEMALIFSEAKNALAKPNTWTFSGTLNGVVEEGGELLATFKIEGAKARIAHLHVGFLLAHGQLFKDALYVDFHAGTGE